MIIIRGSYMYTYQLYRGIASVYSSCFRVEENTHVSVVPPVHTISLLQELPVHGLLPPLGLPVVRRVRKEVNPALLPIHGVHCAVVRENHEDIRVAVQSSELLDDGHGCGVVVMDRMGWEGHVEEGSSVRAC
jgi:hypothetical protein